MNILKLIFSVMLALALFPTTAIAEQSSDLDAQDKTEVEQKSSDVGASSTNVSDLTSTATNNTKAWQNQSAQEIVNSLSLKQKVEQMIMPCVTSWQQSGQQTATRFLQMNDEAKAFFANHNFGGLCLFSQNIDTTEQITTLTYDIQQAALQGNNLPYLLSVDQEGGRVVRLNNGVTFSGNMSLAATTDTNNAYISANVLGSEILSCGMNINFAPDLDVNVNPNNPVINVRSFSDDPTIVSEFGKTYIDGLKDAQVAATVKHFPGHGDTKDDSHSGLPCVDKSKEQLDQCELAAFKQVFSARLVDCVMTAHIQFPQIETEKYTSIKTGEQIYLPATLSKKFLTDILRTEMGYNGVVCTDALNMKAVAEHFNKIDTAVLGINAGVDLLLMPFDVTSNQTATEFDSYINTIVDKVNSGDISINRINESCTRIVQMKLDNKIIGGTDIRTLEQRISDATANVNSKAHQDAENTVANKSITCIKNSNNTLPVKTDGQKILIMFQEASRETSIQQAVSYAFSSGIIHSSASIDFICYENASQAMADEVVNEINSHDQVWCITALKGPDGLKPIQTVKGSGNTEEVSQSGVVDQAITTAHNQGKKFIHISSLQPYDVARYNDADAIVATYNCGAFLMDHEVLKEQGRGPSFRAALNIMTGAVSPSGKLPVNIPKINADYTYSTTEIAYQRGFGITELNPSKPYPEDNPEIITASAAQTNDSAPIMCVLFILFASGSILLYRRWKQQ